MPDFIWRAAAASGKVEEGQITAVSTAAAMKQLRSQGLTPLSLAEVGAMGAPGMAGAAAGIGAGAGPATGLGGFAQPKVRQAKGPVTAPDVLAITSELAIMLRAGLALDNALRVLIDMSHKPSVATLMQGILEAVKGGTPLSRALAAHRELFGDFYINMIRSGEASGQMSAVLDRLVEHMERQRALRDNVISATIYPAILLAVAVLSLVVMLGFVVPQFEKLFKDMGDALPLPTRVVMVLGQVFTQYGWALAIGSAVAGWLLVRWLKSPAGKAWWQPRVLRVPVLGTLMLKYELTLFSRSLGTLLGNGVPMLTALHIATDTVGNAVLRQPLKQVAPFV